MTLALCFGPAWIFSAEVRQAFGLGMLNFNGIPIPRYLGGAHYSWQILNGDRTGGCIVQEITETLDRGDILRAEYFDLPESVKVPRDYFIANFERGRSFIERLAADMLGGVAFPSRPMSELDAERLYFPRLLTTDNAFIDWSWDAEAIMRFCNAFDAPYAGAGTYLGDRLVRLREVSRAEGRDDFHPFTAGLVVRRHNDAAYVAAQGGLLRLGQVVDGASGENCLTALREGMRLHTSPQRLEQARLFRPHIGASLPKAGDR
jgi:methionyl-tRNA formyltransferase